MFSSHVFVWRYYPIQPLAAIFLILFCFWIVNGILNDKAKRRGYDKGYVEGKDAGYRSAESKYTMRRD